MDAYMHGCVDDAWLQCIHPSMHYSCIHTCMQRLRRIQLTERKKNAHNASKSLNTARNARNALNELNVPVNTLRSGIPQHPRTERMQCIERTERTLRTHNAGMRYEFFLADPWSNGIIFGLERDDPGSNPVGDS